MDYTVNPDGALTIGGMSSLALANTYGTPLYVLDETKIRNAMRAFRKSLNENYGGKGLICYASKAFCCKEILRIAQEEGLGADVVSHGELYTAMSVNFNLRNVCMHGNNKTKAELHTGITNKVGRIVVDNLTELETVSALSKALNTEVTILLRIKPGIDAHTHDFCRTGQIDSKFGLALETGEAMDAVKKALSTPNVKLAGIHCHIGSQIFSAEPFVLAAKVMTGFLADIKEETGVELTDLNLGGGYGIVYTDADTPPYAGDVLKQALNAVKETATQKGLQLPFVIFEPGRSIIGEAGTTLYTVGSVKNIPSVNRTYVAVDGGMCDNIRYALYQAKYDMTIANRPNAPKDTIVTVAGKCCESGDLIGKDIPLQATRPGDILAVGSTGAYNFSMFSYYNRNLRPPVVMVNGKNARIIVKGDTVDDILRNDV